MPISPNQGATSGGTTVTITGVNLAGATGVYFGANAATITANTPTSVTVISPAGTGVAQVYVVTPGGQSNRLPFYYIGSPFILSLSSNSGPTAGGNTVTITGVEVATATSVSFGANVATPTVVSGSVLTVTVPAGSSAGQVAVCVNTAGGTCGGVYYSYVDAPTVTTVTPSSGPSSGGTSVTITGTDLSTATNVSFDGTPASFAVVSSTTLVAYTPAGTAGSVDVVVTSVGGSATAVGAFTYVSGPGV